MDELRTNIIKLCNESKLPIEAIYFVIKDIYRDSQELLNEYKISKLKEENETKIEKSEV